MLSLTYIRKIMRSVLLLHQYIQYNQYNNQVKERESERPGIQAERFCNLFPCIVDKMDTTRLLVPMKPAYCYSCKK
jgi:hypothetical protein